MEFTANNKIVQLCLQGMKLEDEGKPAEARVVFLQAWDEATNDFEKFIAAHYVSLHQQNTIDKLKWLESV